MKFAIWQFFLLQGIAGLTLNMIKYPLFESWAGGLATGMFMGAFVIALVEHYQRWLGEIYETP